MMMIIWRWRVRIGKFYLEYIWNGQSENNINWMGKMHNNIGRENFEIGQRLKRKVPLNAGEEGAKHILWTCSGMRKQRDEFLYDFRSTGMSRSVDDSYSPSFRGKLSVPPSRVKQSAWLFKTRPICRPSVPVTKYQCTLPANPDEDRSILHRGRGLKPRNLCVVNCWVLTRI